MRKSVASRPATAFSRPTFSYSWLCQVSISERMCGISFRKRIAGSETRKRWLHSYSGSASTRLRRLAKTLHTKAKDGMSCAARTKREDAWEDLIEGGILVLLACLMYIHLLESFTPSLPSVMGSARNRHMGSYGVPLLVMSFSLGQVPESMLCTKSPMQIVFCPGLDVSARRGPISA
jgi:hypothetical protein